MHALCLFLSGFIYMELGRMLKPCSIRAPAVKVVATLFLPRAPKIRLLRSKLWQHRRELGHRRTARAVQIFELLEIIGK